MKTGTREVSVPADARQAPLEADGPAQTVAVPNSPVEFVPMGEADVDAVLAVERSIYPFPWTRGNFRDSLAAGYSSWVCRQGGDLIGYGVMMVVIEDAHLLNISVRPERQGCGLGSELMGHLFHVARRHGARHMFLEVRPSNAAALALYRRFLFTEIGRRKNYYPAADGREEAVVMAREL